MFAEKVIELIKEVDRNPDTIDQYNVSWMCPSRYGIGIRINLLYLMKALSYYLIPKPRFYPVVIYSVCLCICTIKSEIHLEVTSILNYCYSTAYYYFCVF